MWFIYECCVEERKIIVGDGTCIYEYMITLNVNNVSIMIILPSRLYSTLNKHNW